MSPSFTGVITALITPFKNGQVDYESLEKLLDHQMDNGVDGFVVNGTTAESPTLSSEEVQSLFKFIKNRAGDRPLIVGTGTNSTASSIENTRQAKEMGADASLVVCPYYNKPTQLGMYAHFKAVADAVNLPMILYNVPGRTVVSLTAETVGELAKLSNVVGIKEASGDVNLLADIKARVPQGFCLLSGDDGTCFDFFAQGGHGVISVMSHVLPAKTKTWLVEAQSGMKINDTDFAEHLDLINALFCEPNPTPVKWALKRMGIIESAECRLPLLEFTEENQPRLESLMKKAALI